VLEVIAHLGDGTHRYGSGLLLGNRWVLTAAHVVDHAVAVAVRGPDKMLLEAGLATALIGNQEKLDLALLKVPGAEALPHVPVAAVNRDVTTGRFVERCWSVGYPEFQEVQREGGLSVRKTAQVDGKIPPLSDLGEGWSLLSLQVTQSPRELPPRETLLGASPWAGMSGAVVFAEDDLLVGVVSEHLPRRGASDITVTPLSLLRDPATAPADSERWWERIGVEDPAQLPLLPTPPRRPVMWEDPVAPARYQIEALVAYYRGAFAGRDSYLKALDGFLDDGEHGYAFIHEPTGSGKTAVLVRWVDRIRARPDWGVVFAPVSRRYNTADDAAVLGTLAFQLAAAHGESLERSDLSPDRLRPLIGDYLRREPPEGQRLLVVLDGVDEAVGHPITAGLFPPVPAPGVKIVVSARQIAGRSRQGWLNDFGWQGSFVAPLPTLQPLAAGDVSTVLEQLGGSAASPATDPGVVDEILRMSQGDPLTIRVLAEDLAAGAITVGELALRPPGLREYFRAALAEIVERSDSEAVYALLGLCSLAYGPLSHEDLAALAPGELGRRNRRLRAVGKLERYLVGDGSKTAGYVLGHPRLRELYAEELLDQAERGHFAGRFVGYGRSWWQNPSRPPAEYLRRFLIAHLAQSGEWDLARAVLTETVDLDGARRQPWAAAHYRAQGSHARYLADLDVLWGHAEQEDDFATAFRCALIAATTHSLGANLPPELLVGLVTTGTPQGRWSIPAALEHISQMPEPQQQRQALSVLLDATTDEMYWPWSLAIATAAAISDEYQRAWALAALAPHLPTEALPQALNAARAISDKRPRADVLTALAPHLPLQAQAEVLVEIRRAARAISYEGSPVALLAALAPHLPTEARPEIFAEALDAARAIEDEGLRGWALRMLAPQLPAELLPQALDVAQAITEETYRARALSSLADHLPAELLPQALDAARAISQEGSRVDALASLAPLLPTEAQPEILTEALEAARAINDERSRSEALTTLAKYLPTEAQPEILTEALEVARAINDEHSRSEALTTLAKYLPSELLPQALEATQAMNDEHSRGWTLNALANHLPAELLSQALDALQTLNDGTYLVWSLSALADRLPAELLPRALDTARATVDGRSRAQALAALALGLPADAQAEIFAEALEAARAVSDEGPRAQALAALVDRLPANAQAAVLAHALEAAAASINQYPLAEVLALLAPHLPVELVPQALDAALAIIQEYTRAQALAALAPHLPAELVPQALDAALAIIQEYTGAQALAALAPHLPAELVLQALDAARAISNEYSRAQALAALAPGLPAEAQAGIFAEALDAAQAEYSRSEALAALADRPHSEAP
jgi:hypothetical protein